MLGKFLTFLFLGCVAADTAPTFSNIQPSNQQVYRDHIARSGFGVNANAGFENGGLGFQGGLNTPIGGFDGNVGLRAPNNFLNSNLLTTVVIGLGLLSLINIVATVVTPWFSNLGSDEDDEEEDRVEKGRRFQRNINLMADAVLNGIETFGKKHE